jgi:AraC-like DNA-binding protein
MPLYMDFHDLDQFSDETLQQLKEGHKLDLAVQSKYKVEYKHYYVSKENKKAFCVMEGPDKESCEAVHREAHGVVACNIVEVELNQYGAMMGLQVYNSDGLHLHEDGTIDSGLRTILFISTLAFTSNNRLDGLKLSNHFLDYSNELKEVLSRYRGREIASGNNETIYAFTSCASAVHCGSLLQERISYFNKKLDDKKIRFETTIAINAGEPVTRESEFFGETLQLARRLSHTGKDGDMIISACVNEYAQPSVMRTKKSLKITSLEDERFINRIIGLLESKIKDENFKIIELSELAGISRPHLYRRVHNLFGRSPNHLISEMRLREAAKLIHKKFGNISEIAYEVGYNNPSYFAKCFQKRFGILPSCYGMQKFLSSSQMGGVE